MAEQPAHVPDPGTAYLVYTPMPHGSAAVVGFGPGADGHAAAVALSERIGGLVVAVPVVADHSR